MKRVTSIGLTIIGLVMATVFAAGTNLEVPADDPTFTFAVAGDIGWNESSSKSKVFLGALKKDLTNLSFFLANGDLSYSPTPGTEAAWCSYIKFYVGSAFPFQLLGADHEDNDPTRIDNFTACLPDHMSSTGVYGKEYYFDYPVGAPLARFIQISPDMTYLPDVKWTYKANDTHFQWTMKAIDGARAAGIPWVIVSVHKPCIGLIGTSCPMGVDLFNAMLIKKVDLIISGDQHTYQRSHQLRCAVVSSAIYFPQCFADTDSTFAKGAGSVVSICGTGGRGFSPLGADGDRPYFAAAMGSNTPGNGWGYLRVTISSTTLTARTMFSGTWQDSFTIGG